MQIGLRQSLVKGSVYTINKLQRSKRASDRRSSIMAALDIDLKQHIKCEDVVKIAENAAAAIMAVYNSKVRVCWSAIHADAFSSHEI